MNPSQQNNDGDALGNPCDPAPNNPLVPPVAPTDQDGDGVSNTHDNCPCTYNASQTDSDGDDYGDTCDACSFHLVELPIYGLGRIGVAMPDIDIENDTPPDSTFTRHLNQKYYELTDHLGNVRAVLGDRKRTNTPGAGNYYADIRSYSHIYPFGMQQPGRHWEASMDTMYRYGFNGMETDPEVKEGAGQHYTTYFRQYDPRLGRWWSNDPVVQQGESPYAAMFNNPILFSDPFGNDPPGGDEGDRKELTLDPDDPWKVTFTLHVGESEYARIMNNRAQREQLEHERRVAEIAAWNAAWYSEQVADYHRKLDAVDRGVVNHLKDAGNAVVDFGVGAAEQLWVGGLTHSWSIAGTALLGPLGTLPAAYNMPVPKFDGTLATPTEKLTGVVAFATTVGGGALGRGIWAGVSRGATWLGSRFGSGSGFSIFHRASAQAGEELVAGAAAAEGSGATASTLLSLGDDAAILNQVAARVPKRGWADIIVHGTADGSAFSVNGQTMTATELYQTMLSNGYSQGQRIRLMSCFSGSVENGAAQQLSVLTGAQVVAPTDLTWNMFGQWFVANGGKFKLFVP